MNAINNLFDLILFGIGLATIYGMIQIIKELHHPLDLDKYENDQKKRH